jgi:hypothetical protein
MCRAFWVLFCFLFGFVSLVSSELQALPFSPKNVHPQWGEHGGGGPSHSFSISCAAGGRTEGLNVDHAKLISV